MPKETYNPISDAFDSKPPLRPGTVVVSFKNGTATKVEANQESAISSLIERIKSTPPGYLIGILIALIIFFWFIGLAGSIFLVLGLIGFIFFIITNKTSPISQSIMGSQAEYYLVDISRKIIIDERRAQLSDPGVYVIVHFEYRVKVISPAGVVSEGISDVREYLSDKFYLEIDKIASNGKLEDKLSSLRKDLENLFSNKISDNLLEISSATFDVRLEGAPASAIAKLSEANIKKQEIMMQSDLDSVERETLQYIINNDSLLLAEVMRSDDEKARELLNIRMNQKEISFSQNLELFKAALENGVLEAHQIKRDYPDFFANLTNSMPGLLMRQDKNKALENKKETGSTSENSKSSEGE